MKKIVILFVASMMMCGVSFANTVAEDCGCGLGKELIGEKEGLAWNLLGTCLNGTSGNQTFGMSSGTLGCDYGGKIVMNEKIDLFVADNMDNLAVDIAAGQGESLEALAEIAQVSADNQAAFFATLQDNFDVIYPTAEVSHEQVTGNITAIVKAI